MRMKNAVSCLLSAFVAGFVPFASPQTKRSTAELLAAAEERLRSVYDRRELNANAFRAAWLPDGSGYTRLEGVETEGNALVRYEASTGRRSVLLSPAHILPAGAAKPLSIEDYVLSPDGSRILIQANGRAGEDPGRRIVDYWVFEPASGTLGQVMVGVD
ncbi:MAG: hypothetical protein FJY82_10770, partial [Candidatus Aminicenantes bacterium]|nr:hypothetical protein [Candidatus Aminicenantes bacterium]